MNKELILKYRNEFDHWLNGGNVQVKFMCDSKPKWYTDKESFEETGRDNFTDVLYKEYKPKDRLSSILIVIDDEYVELRKALAEGKTIQFSKNPRDPESWFDQSDLQFLMPIEHYHIKPDEPKFKVGDIVRTPAVLENGEHITILAKVSKDGQKLTQLTLPENWSNWVTSIGKHTQHWQPKPGEWFFIPYAKGMILTKLYKIENEIAYTMSGYSATLNNCEPFIGILPSTIKDNK